MVANEERLVLTVPQVARMLGVSRATGYMLARTNQLPVIRLGKRLLVPKAALEKVLSGYQGKPAGTD